MACSVDKGHGKSAVKWSLVDVYLGTHSYVRIGMYMYVSKGDPVSNGA